MKSILVVDDDFSSRAMLSIALKQAGFRVETVGSGHEALERLGEEIFDWLITDGRMVPMDGFELSEKVKSLNPEMRIVMMSAVYSERDIQTYPIERIFSKPIALDQLVFWLQRSRVNGEASA